MLAGMTAVDVLVLVLVVGFLAALFGWAGGKGAMLSLTWRVDQVERVAGSVLARAKGQAGQASTQKLREQTQSRMAEAETLKAQLDRARGGLSIAQRDLTESEFRARALARGLTGPAADKDSA